MQEEGQFQQSQITIHREKQKIYAMEKGNIHLFQDLLYQKMSGAAAPTDDKGGVNPKQTGLGMNVASIDKIIDVEFHNECTKTAIIDYS